MRFVRWMMVLTIVFLGVLGLAASQRGGGERGEPPAAQRGGRGGGRGGMTTMSLITTAWADGGQIPITYTQAGNETSPGIQWSGVPAGTVSFALVFHDIDAPTGDGTGDILHWLVWNIPGTATSIAQARPDGYQLEDGSRQISVSGFRYRGPGAPASGPFHHYVMELYALDTMLDVTVTPPTTQAPNPNVGQIRTQIFQAMANHVRGKAAYVGRFRRPQ